MTQTAWLSHLNFVTLHCRCPALSVSHAISCSNVQKRLTFTIYRCVHRLHGRARTSHPVSSWQFKSSRRLFLRCQRFNGVGPEHVCHHCIRGSHSNCYTNGAVLIYRVDVKELYTYQQLYIYFIPIFTNLGFINAVVALVRFLLFRKHLKQVGQSDLVPKQPHQSLNSNCSEQHHDF